MSNVLLGTWAEIPTPYATHIMAEAGLDFSIIDMEHGVIGYELAQNMIFAAHSLRKKAYIRVPAIEEEWILRALDTGCDGIVFPQVTGINEVEKIKQFSLFAPEGERGYNPFTCFGGYRGREKSFINEENKRIKIVVILEGKEAFQNIEEILEYDEIDVIYIGQYDLSMALGVPGDITNPLVLSTMEAAVKKIRKKGKMAGCMVHSVVEAKEYIAQGFNYIVYKVDSGLLYKCVNDFVREVKQ